MNRHWYLGFLLGVSFNVLMPGMSLAQRSDPQRIAAAQILFEQAVGELNQKNYAKACPKFEEAAALVPEALGTKMKLGECYEGLGKLASAWSQYKVIEGPAQAQGQLKRAQAAAERAMALYPQLATLRIDVPPKLAKIPGFMLKRDGLVIGLAQWGTFMPVDAGDHNIVASAPGYKSWTKTIYFKSNGIHLTARVGDLEVEPKKSPISEEERGGEWMKPLGIGLTVGGVVGLAGALGMGYLSMKKKDESNDGHCDKATDLCLDDIGLKLREDARLFGNIANVLAGAGGALVIGGVIFILVSPTKGKTEESKKGNFEIRPTLGGLIVGGSF